MYSMLVMLVSLFVCEPEYIRSKNCNVAIPLDKPRGALGENNDKYVYNKKKQTKIMVILVLNYTCQLCNKQ